jgi:MFS family permease
MWLLSISLVMFNILVMAMGTFLPPFLMKVHGLDSAKAGLLSSIGSIVMLVSCPLGGFLSDRLNRKKWIIAIGLTLISFFWLFCFSAPLRYVPATIILWGLLAGPTITVILSVLPDVVKRPELMGFGMAILMFTMKLGQFIGPVMFGKIFDVTGSWSVGAYAMIPVCLIGAVTASMMKTR